MIEQRDLPSGDKPSPNTVNRLYRDRPIVDGAEPGYPFQISLEKQAFLARGKLEILDRSPVFSFLPIGDTFPNYSARGYNNAPHFDSLDAGIAKVSMEKEKKEGVFAESVTDQISDEVIGEPPLEVGHGESHVPSGPDPLQRLTRREFIPKVDEAVLVELL